MSITAIVNDIFNIYFWVIIVRIFLTWIPSINWYSQPYRFLALISDIVLNPFRRIIPAMGGIDFSPIVALLFLQILQFAVVRMLYILGV